MSAECHIHGVDLLGFMDEAYCPVCRNEHHLVRIKWLEGEVVRYMEQRAQDQREVARLKEAFNILWACNHGDESTCGCRERAGSLAARAEGE